MHYMRITRFRRLLWTVLTLNVISRLLYFRLSKFPPHTIQMPKDYQPHRKSADGHMLIVKYVQMLKFAHITWMPMFSELPLS
jgi:hypothetical protein